MKPVVLAARRLPRLLFAVVLAVAGWAHADEYADMAKLIDQGKPLEALTQLEPRIAAHPRDPQLRFLRGVAQAAAGQQDEAIDSFVKLTEEYPELPEPYNNLAVLYARQNQLDKARAALEMAVYVKPDYAAAQENLGDIHVRLAIQSYTRAQKSDAATGASVAPKLKLLDALISAKPAR